MRAEIQFSPKGLAALVFVAGLAAIGMQAYELNKVRLETRNLLPGKLEKAQAAAREPVERRVNLAELRKLNLMGNPEAKAEPTVAQQVKVVDTSLKLELVGTIRGALGDRDSALIAAKGKETKRYYVGDEIEGGAVLDSVDEEMVTLKRGGVIETLRYSKSDTTAARASSGAPVPAANRRAVRQQPATQPAENNSQDADNPAAETPSQVQTPPTFRERLKGRNRPLTPVRPQQK